MIPKHAGRRGCKRFVVPGAKMRFKRTGLFGLFGKFSKAHPVLNMSKGGMAFRSGEKFRRKEKIVAQLLLPGESPLDLHSRVRWLGQEDSEGVKAIGITFVPFGSSRGWNPREALEVLRKLDAEYTKKEKEKEKIDLDLQDIW